MSANNEETPWLEAVVDGDPTFSVQFSRGPGARNSWMCGFDTQQDASDYANAFRKRGYKARVVVEGIVREILEDAQ